MPTRGSNKHVKPKETKRASGSGASSAAGAAAEGDIVNLLLGYMTGRSNANPLEDRTREVFERLFQGMDADSDRRVSWDEFFAFLRRRKHRSRAAELSHTPARGGEGRGEGG